MIRRVVLASVLTVTALAFLGPAQSGAVIRVGVQDQDYASFGSSLFQNAGFKRVRFLVSYNVALRNNSERRYFDDFVRVARQWHVEVLVNFQKPPGTACPGSRSRCKLPSVSSYKRAFKAFRKRYPRLKIIATWNEENHRSQPTYRSPKRAAQYFNVARRYCRGCTLIAADVIDETNMVRWLRTFKRYAHGERLWGLHNYRDTNLRRGQKTGGTRRLLRAVRGKVWLTETGGIVYFQLPEGGVLFPRDENRAAQSLSRMFSLARKYRSRISRIYVYNWQQSSGDNRFDAGLLDSSGNPRPGYDVVVNALRQALFAP